jgi:hypothetical protein
MQSDSEPPPHPDSVLVQDTNHCQYTFALSPTALTPKTRGRSHRLISYSFFRAAALEPAGDSSSSQLQEDRRNFGLLTTAPLRLEFRLNRASRDSTLPLVLDTGRPESAGGREAALAVSMFRHQITPESEPRVISDD